MSLRDLGKNDISEETQAFKDKLASRDTENAGLHTRLIRREAELHEIQATLDETVYKLSKEAERALNLEKEVSARSSELATERISLRNAELALQSAQEKLKAEERAKKELESTLDTVSLHSQTTSAEHQAIQREKRGLESRVRELERIVQTYEAKASNMPRRNGRPRSSSVSNFRLPAVEQELNDAKAQLHIKDKNLRVLEQKLAQAQHDLVKAENAHISTDKAGQKRISELLSILENKEEELESLRETDNTGEREEELLKRIDEDAAKIVALEKLVAESQATRTTQVRIQKLQSQLKAESDKVHRSEELQNRLLHEKEELARQYDTSRREVAEGHELLMARDRQIRELAVRHASNGVPMFPDESALADHIQTLLQAIDRLRDERDGLKRALEFSEVEYRITTESFQSRIASLTNQLTRENSHDIAMNKSNIGVEQRMKRLTSCATAFTVVISHLQTRLELTEDRLSAALVDFTSSSTDYQHDIRRLEANAKLHEERIVEMTSELELLASQKEAMVEDCAEARGARDEAIEKLEAAEEDMEQMQQQLQRAKEEYEAQLSAMSSTVANQTSENQRATALLANLEAENARFIRELDSLGRLHHHLNEQLDAATSRSQSLELESSTADAIIQQAILSLAVIHRVHRDCTRRLQESYRDITSLESQLDTLIREAEQRDTLLNNAEKEKHDLLQQLSDVSTDSSQNDILRNSLQEKDLKLLAARQLLEETKFRYTKAEAKLLERVAAMNVELQARTGQAEDIDSLRVELESVRTQLQNSLENFAELDKVHGDVIQDFTTTKEIFEHRLTETDEHIRRLEADHERNLATLETKYRCEADILTTNLEDREHEVDELRQQLQDMSEAHSRVEAKLHEELKSYEASHVLANDLEKDLRRSTAEMCQRLAQTEAETLSLQEERQLLQAQITGLRAEIQRSTALTRYLEGQVRESEDACMQLRDSLQRSELTLAGSEKAAKATEFNLTLQVTQHEKVVSTLRREIASLQSGPELRSALADLEEKNREMDDLLKTKCQEIEEYDDRILETLKANKKLTSKVESLTRKVQALQTKLSLMKNQPHEPGVEAIPMKKTTSTSSPPVPRPIAMQAGSYPSSSHARENSVQSLTLRAKTPEPLMPPVVAPLLSSHTPCRSEPPESEVAVGKKRSAPDDDERDSVPAEGHYSTDAYLRGPTPRRRAHGHPASFTPVRGASLRKAAGAPSPGRRTHAGMPPSEIIMDVTNSPRGPPGKGDGQLKKKGWLGKIRGGTGSQHASSSSRLGAFGGR